MAPSVGFEQPTPGNVGVALRGRQAGVTQELLDRPDVGAGLEQVGGERVPERVRAHPAPRQVRADVAVHLGPRVPGRHPFLPPVEVQGLPTPRAAAVTGARTPSYPFTY